MPKNKVHKGLLKRVRISKSGKVRHRSAYHKHLSSHKSGKRLRQLRRILLNFHCLLSGSARLFHSAVDLHSHILGRCPSDFRCVGR